MKTSTISKKTSLIFAHGILWISAISVTSTVLMTGISPTIIIAILMINGVASIWILGHELKDK
jgi:hypothetical protein